MPRRQDAWDEPAMEHQVILAALKRDIPKIQTEGRRCLIDSPRPCKKHHCSSQCRDPCIAVRQQCWDYEGGQGIFFMGWQKMKRGSGVIPGFDRVWVRQHKKLS